MQKLIVPLTTLLATLATLLLCSCVESDPRYTQDVVAFDDALVGTWTLVDVKGEAEGSGEKTRTELVLSPRTLHVKNGRYEPENTPTAGSESAHLETANAYDAVLRVEGEKQPFEVELKGFLLRIDGWSYFAFQPSNKAMAGSPLSSFALPLHQVVRTERDGDELVIWLSRIRLAWLPHVQMLDGPSPATGEPVVPSAPADAGPTDSQIVVTGDIDRFVAALRTPAMRASFSEPTLVFKRSQTQGSSAK